MKFLEGQVHEVFKVSGGTRCKYSWINPGKWAELIKGFQVGKGKHRK